MYTIEENNEIKLYGTIWESDGPYISNTIERFAAKHLDGIVVRLHSPGGSVFDGNLIYNTLSKLKSPVDVVIDGLAASMATIIMLAGRKISISENAFLMVHAPSGYVSGSSKDFESASKLLKSMENNFINQYAKRTGKDKTEVAKWLEGDNWFSATEALEAGLVDEIVGTTLELDMTAFKEMKLVAMMDSFPSDKPESRIVSMTKDNTKSDINTKPDMKLNAKSIAALGIAADASDENVNAAIEALSDRNAQLTAQMKADKDARIKLKLDAAIAEGRLLATQRSQFEKLAEKDMLLFDSTLEVLPKKADITSSLENGGGGKSAPIVARESWDFDKWRKEDPKGLIEMKANDPEGYQSLLSSK